MPGDTVADFPKGTRVMVERKRGTVVDYSPDREWLIVRWDDSPQQDRHIRPASATSIPDTGERDRLERKDLA